MPNEGAVGSVRRLFDLTGKVAVVTGGSRGLGLRIAESLGELGSQIALVARKPTDLDFAVESLSRLGIDATAFPFDLGQIEVIPALVESILARFGRIDVLVNNAAVSWAQPAGEHSLEGWRKVMRVNVEALFRLTQVIGAKEMIPRRAGIVLNVASVGGLRGNRPDLGACTLAYSTSKGAIVNFTRALAAEWGPYGINVNSLCPGFFHSRLADSLLERIEPRLKEATPLQRVAEDHDFKGAAAFLCSAASRHVTGQNLVVDGGLSAC
jgi:NAD(P)-dependent dehydrogenase (short-subunit alcohol dehydrogenase family)